MGKGDDAEVATPPAYAAPVVRHIIKDNKKTLCTIVATVLTCAVIMVGSVGLSVHFLRSDNSAPKANAQQTPQRFDVIVNVYDKTEKDEIDVNPDKKQIIITQKTRNFVTMEDFSTGFMAAKDINKRKCYVMPISENRQTDSFDRAYASAEQAKNNGSVAPQGEVKKIPVLDNVINPQVLQFTAGEAVSGFCAGFDTHWLVDVTENDREKRQAVVCEYYLYIYYDPIDMVYRYILIEICPI